MPEEFPSAALALARADELNADSPYGDLWLVGRAAEFQPNPFAPVSGHG